MKGSVRYSPPKKPEGGGPSVLFLRCRGVGTMWDEDLSHILAWTCRDLKISTGQLGCPPDEDLVSKIFFVYIECKVFQKIS